MLNKRILRKLAPPICKKTEEYFSNVEKLDFVLQFSTHIVAHQRLLFIDIFGKKGDLLRVFIHRTNAKKDEYEYTTYNYVTKKWLSASIQNLRKRDECGIALGVGEVVVDRLKAVKVEHQGSDLFLFQMQKRFLDVVEFVTVIYARQFVDIDALILQADHQPRKRDRVSDRLERNAVNERLDQHRHNDRREELPHREIPQRRIFQFREEVV